MNSKNFNRKNLSNLLFRNLGFSKNFSSNLIDNFFETLVSGLIKSNKLKISAFGTFRVIHKKERIGRNPKTKVEAKIASRKVVKFKPSQLFLEKLNK